MKYSIFSAALLLALGFAAQALPAQITISSCNNDRNACYISCENASVRQYATLQQCRYTCDQTHNVCVSGVYAAISASARQSSTSISSTPATSGTASTTNSRSTTGTVSTGGGS